VKLLVRLSTDFIPCDAGTSAFVTRFSTVDDYLKHAKHAHWEHERKQYAHAHA
jgi:hypothetical protein